MKPYALIGIHGANVKDHISFVKGYMPESLSVGMAKMEIHKEAILENGESSGFGFVETDFLYAFLIKQKPSKIIQVGCGVATAVMLRACREGGFSTKIVCVEPYPTPYLEKLAENGQIELIRQQAQRVDVDILTNLNPGELFFLDSTHTVKPGSEVNKIILEIFPRLQKGVWLHIHDVYFPYDYTREMLTTELFFWSESALLQAFLTHNSKFEIKASFSMMHYDQSEELKKYFPRYEPQTNIEGAFGGSGKHFPSSLYLEVVN